MITRIGKFEIQEELGRGAFTRVFRALDPTVGRVVAVKVLTDNTDQRLGADFRNGAAAVANLRHKGIVTIYELGEHEGRAFVAMEYLQGRNLRQVIAGGSPLSLLQKMGIMSQVADALDFAHALDFADQNSAARLDLKPANIMLLADGSVKIMGFAMGVPDGGDTRTADPSYILNTALYTAPEQFIDPAAGDVRSDIFVYGVVFYELLTGKHPFEAPDAVKVSHRIIHESPAPLRSLAPECSEYLERILHRALQRPPRLRYQNFEDLQLELEPIIVDLRSQRAATLIANARQLLDQQRPDAAEPLICEILQLLPDNLEARQLRAVIRSQAQKQGVVSGRVAAPVPQPGRIQPGKTETSAEHRQKAAQLAGEAERAYAQMSFGQAHEKASEALQLDRGNRTAFAVLEASSAMRGLESGSIIPASPQPAWRESPEAPLGASGRDQAVEQACREASVLLEERDFAGAIHVLEQALGSFPGDARLRRAREEAFFAFESFKRQRAVEQLRGQAAALREARDFSGAIRILEQGLASFPEEVVLRSALAETTAEFESHKRSAAVAETVERCERLRKDGRFAEALQFVQSAIEKYSDERALLDLRRRLENEWEQRKRSVAEQAELEREKAFRNELSAAEALLSRSRFDEAQTTLLTLGARKPGSAEVQVLLEKVRTEQAKKAAARGAPNTPPVVAKSEQPASPKVSPAVQPVPTTQPQPTGSGSFGKRGVVWASVAFIVLAAGLVVWKSSQNAAPIVARTPSVAPATQPVTPREAVSPNPAEQQQSSIPVPAMAKAKDKNIPGNKSSNDQVAKAVQTTIQTPSTAVAQQTPAPKKEEDDLRPPSVSEISGTLPAGIRIPLLLGSSPAVAPPPVVPPAPKKEATPPANVRVGGNFQAAKVISGPQPVIPYIARQQRVSGTVQLEATITKEGVVKDVKVLGGPTLLVNSAVEAIKNRRYQPATLNGVAIETKVPIQMVFEPPR